MTDIISKEYIDSVVNNVAIALNLKDWSFIEEKLELKAQNYFGVLIPVVLKEKVNEECRSFSIMLKLAPLDDKYRVSGAVTAMFAREIFIYSKVFWEFKNIQMHLKLDFQYIVPECYFVCQDYCKEVIAMQNICDNGYRPYIHCMFLDIDHIIISMKNLAKFHALSFVLESEKNYIYDEVKKICVPLLEKTNKRYIDVMVNRLEKATQKFQNSKYVPLLKDLKKNCVTYIEATYMSSEKNCLCHGDIWKENIMFKYEDNKPSSVCFIDYQTTRMCSPAFDVLYLITSSTDSKLRQFFFNVLLDVYYNTLVKNLSDAAIDMDKIYNRSQFDKDLRTVAPACLTVANTALWLSNGLQEDGHVKSKHVLLTESEKAEAVLKYKSIIKGIIDDFNIYGYLPITSDDEN